MEYLCIATSYSYNKRSTSANYLSFQSYSIAWNVVIFCDILHMQYY